jgi:hypothetical protein
MSLSPDDAPSAFFSAGRPHTVSVIGGTIRAGRDRATRAELLTRLSEARTAITGQDARSLVVGLNEIDPTPSTGAASTGASLFGVAG